jgi:type I restriction enzyme S subunit
MSFPTYPEYKDSGVEWLGKVPSHWGTVQARRIFSQIREPRHKEDEQLSATQKYGVIPQHLFMELEDQKLCLALNGIDNFKHVQKNDFVISLRSFQGGIELSLFSGCVSPAYTVLRTYRDVDPKFWAYLFKSFNYISCLQSVTDGIRDGKSISYEQFGTICIPTPPISEQSAIAAFLDYETAKIDALIAEQETLIELLKEKRQAVISHAVTKGLDPSAPMKDSGVKWLGNVPQHWTVLHLKRTLLSYDYGISDPLFPDGEIAVLRMGNIQNGEITYEDIKYTKQTPSELLLKNGDLLFNRTNSLDLIGKVGLFHENNGHPTSFASYLVRFRMHDNFDPHFFSFLLNTQGILGEARSLAFIAIGQCNLNPTRYSQLLIATPPFDEQNRISSFLKNETKNLEQLIKEAQHAISLLKERRSALITAAVTGKIDVRGYAPQPEAA